jgi:hypothetical protein
MKESNIVTIYKILIKIYPVIVEEYHSHRLVLYFIQIFLLRLTLSVQTIFFETIIVDFEARSCRKYGSTEDTTSATYSCTLKKLVIREKSTRERSQRVHFTHENI